MLDLCSAHLVSGPEIGVVRSETRTRRGPSPANARLPAPHAAAPPSPCSTASSTACPQSKGPLKPSMQDYFVAVSDATGQSLWSMAPPEVAATLARRGGSLGPFVLTGIFDGHGHGDHAARTAQESTLQAIAGDPDVLASLGERAVRGPLCAREGVLGACCTWMPPPARTSAGRWNCPAACDGGLDVRAPWPLPAARPLGRA